MFSYESSPFEKKLARDEKWSPWLGAVQLGNSEGSLVRQQPSNEPRVVAEP